MEEAERLFFHYQYLEAYLAYWALSKDQTCTLCHKNKRENATYDPIMKTVAYLCLECYENYDRNANNNNNNE